MLEVSVISTIDELIASRDEWNDLLSRSQYFDKVFLRCEWFITWWRSFGYGRDLKIIVVRDNDNLAAIFPFMLEMDKFLWKRVRKLKAIENDHTYFYDVIALKGLPILEHIYEALFSYLRNEKWDLIELLDIKESSSTVESLRIVAKKNNLKLHLSEPIQKNPYILINGTFEQYYQSLSRSFLRRLGRGERKLKDIGKVSLEEIRGDDVSDSMLEEGYNIESQGWKGRRGTAISCSENTRKFYTEFAKVAAKNEWFTLYFLKVNDTRIAFLYNVRYRGIEYAMKTGYKDDYAKYSPGNILQKYNLEASFKDNLKQFEFLGIFTEHKKNWTSQAQMSLEIYLYNCSVFSKMLYFIQFGLKSYLKRFKFIVRINRSLNLLINQNKKRHIKHGS